MGYRTRESGDDGEVSRLDESPRAGSAPEATISKIRHKRTRETSELSVAFSSLGPTLNSWANLDLEMVLVIHLYQ